MGDMVKLNELLLKRRDNAKKRNNAETLQPKGTQPDYPL